MKRNLTILTLVLAVLGVALYAKSSTSPLPDWFANYLNSDPNLTVSNLGGGVQRTAHGKYKFSINGGGTSGTAVPLGIVLPAGAKVKRAFYYVTTALSGTDASYGNTSNAQIGCGTGAHFKAATNHAGATSSDSFVEGIQTGTAATMTGSSTSCTVGMTLAVGSLPPTAGEYDLFIDYVLPK